MFFCHSNSQKQIRRKGFQVVVIGLLRGGVPRGGGSLIFPKVPQSSLGILRVPQLPLPLNTPQEPYKVGAGEYVTTCNTKGYQEETHVAQ